MNNTKELKSESVPEFQESIDNMPQESKDRVDAAIKEAAHMPTKEEILNQVETNGELLDTNQAIRAMNEWVSIKCEERDKRIKELKSLNELTESQRKEWADLSIRFKQRISELEAENKRLKNHNKNMVRRLNHNL